MDDKNNKQDIQLAKLEVKIENLTKSINDFKKQLGDVVRSFNK